MTFFKDSTGPLKSLTPNSDLLPWNLSRQSFSETCIHVCMSGWTCIRLPPCLRENLAWPSPRPKVATLRTFGGVWFVVPWDFFATSWKSVVHLDRSHGTSASLLQRDMSGRHRSSRISAATSFLTKISPMIDPSTRVLDPEQSACQGNNGGLPPLFDGPRPQERCDDSVTLTFYHDEGQRACYSELASQCKEESNVLRWCLEKVYRAYIQ